MTINILATGIDLTPSLRAYIETKLSTIGRFIRKYEGEGEVSMAVEIARTTRHHRHGEVFSAEINLPLPGRMLRAVEQAADARIAVDAAKRTLRLEIEKYKTRADAKRVARRV